jgi:hypothetical protein
MKEKQPTSDESRPKKRRRFRIPSLIGILIIIVVLAAAFFLLAKPLFNIDLRERLKKNRTTAASVAVLEEVRDLFLFQTVEYIYKTVFPYDFVPADYDWRSLLRKVSQETPLSAEETEYLSIYRFCEEIDIRLDSNRYEFVVISAVVRGGFDLQGTVYERPEEFENLKEYARVDEEEKTLFLRLPKPVIVDFIIEDPTAADYTYPDIEISPENWKKLTDFVSGEIREQVIAEGILELAKKRGQAFIEKLLIDAGLKRVIFLDP